MDCEMAGDCPEQQRIRCLCGKPYATGDVSGQHPEVCPGVATQRTADCSMDLPHPFKPGREGGTGFEPVTAPCPCRTDSCDTRYPLQVEKGTDHGRRIVPDRQVTWDRNSIAREEETRKWLEKGYGPLGMTRCVDDPQFPLALLTDRLASLEHEIEQDGVFHDGKEVRDRARPELPVEISHPGAVTCMSRDLAARSILDSPCCTDMIRVGMRQDNQVDLLGAPSNIRQCSEYCLL